MNTQAWKQMYMYQKYRDCLMENFWMEREGALYLGELEELREREMKRADIVVTLETLGFKPSPELVDSVLKEMLKSEPPKDMCLIVRDEKVHAEMVNALLEETEISVVPNISEVDGTTFLSGAIGFGVAHSLAYSDLNHDFSMTVDSLAEFHEAWRKAEKEKEEEKTMSQKKGKYRKSIHRFLNGGKKW